MTIRFYSEESVPVEMHRARIVQKLQLLTIEERLEKIQEAGNNTFLLYNKDIYLDMLTDSGVNAMSDEMQAAMFVADDSYAGSSTYLKMANKLKEIYSQSWVGLVIYDYSPNDGYRKGSLGVNKIFEYMAAG